MKNIPLSRLIVVSILFSFYALSIYSQDTTKIMSYNLLNYNGTASEDQNFRKTIKYINPDILVVGEIISEAAMNNMLTNVMNYYNAGLYSAGTFINGYDTDNAIFYKQTKFTFISNTPILTTLRDINLFTLIHNSSSDTVRLFGVHLKASNSFSDQQQRLAEVNVLRSVTNTFLPQTEFLVLGDFNIYTSAELAYQKLILVQQGNEGHFVDPLNLVGTWNQFNYASYHTQSTRTRALSDSGATGGMDDRFDMILNSKALTEEGKIKYIPGSLIPVGNDGNHYNDSINKRPNTSVPDSIADALYFGSDHLPVIALYKFDVHPNSINLVSEVIPNNFKLYQNYPNPFNPATKIKFDIGANSNEPVNLSIYDILGNKVMTLIDNKNLKAGSYEIEMNASEYSNGIYFYKLDIGNLSETKSMILIK